MVTESVQLRLLEVCWVVHRHGFDVFERSAQSWYNGVGVDSECDYLFQGFVHLRKFVADLLLKQEIDALGILLVQRLDQVSNLCSEQQHCQRKLILQNFV